MSTTDEMPVRRVNIFTRRGRLDPVLQHPPSHPALSTRGRMGDALSKLTLCLWLAVQLHGVQGVVVVFTDIFSIRSKDNTGDLSRRRDFCGDTAMCYVLEKYVCLETN